jgi:dihydromethanopterin reductase
VGAGNQFLDQMFCFRGYFRNHKTLPGIPMADIRVVCAIGRRGQLGLGGRMPWEGNRDDIYKADVERFFRLTKGHVVIAGPKTFASFPDWARCDRTVVQIRSNDDPNEIIQKFRDRVIYVGGGPAVWRAYAPLIGRWDITRLPYDGRADRFFDQTWLFA